MAQPIERIKLMKVFFDRYHSLILLMVGLIVLLAGYFLFLDKPLRLYRENLSLLGGLNDDIAAAKTELENAKAYTDKLYQPTVAEQKLLAMALPDKPDSSSLVEHLTSLASRAGFTVNSINVEEANGRASDKVKQSNLGKVSVQLKVSGGGYNELKQLINLLESSVMMIDVSSINFGSKSPAYELNLLVYYYNNL